MAALGLSWGMWDLIPQLGIEPGPPALRMQSLSHWATREVPKLIYSKLYFMLWNLTMSPQHAAKKEQLQTFILAEKKIKLILG